MLTLTDNCATIVKTMSNQPNTAGIRISHDEQSNAHFALATAAAPLADDQVVEQDGATVFLDSTAADELDDKVLDAGVDDAGNLRFAIAEQA